MGSISENGESGKTVTTLALLAGFGVLALYLFKFKDLILLAMTLSGMA